MTITLQELRAVNLASQVVLVPDADEAGARFDSLKEVPRD